MDKCVFPLGNGVGIYSNSKLCVSIIDQSGNKKVKGMLLKEKKKFFSFPLIRGLIYFFYGLYIYFLTFFIQEKLDDRKEEDKNKSYKSARKINYLSGYIFFISSLLLAFLVGFLLLGIASNYLFNRAFPNFINYYFRSFMIALIRFALLYIVFSLLRFAPFMSGLYSFNGAGCLFLSEKEKEDAIKARTYPLNFLNFLLNVFLFSTFMVSLIAINIVWWANFLINLAIFFVCIILCYEFLRIASLSKFLWIKDITLVTNWLVCSKPNITHEEVLQVALIELNTNNDFIETGKDRISMSTLYAEMQTKLKQSERFEQSDMDWIIATILNKNRAELKLIHSVSQKEYKDVMRACSRRAKGEPLSSIFGFVDFYGLRFDVNKKVLSPRMETEILVEEVIKKSREIEVKTILDLCTGSGAIAVTLAKYTDCKITATDISKQALQVAEGNAEKNNVNVEFIQSDLFNDLKKNKRYDIIVSNPPYIKSGDIEKLDIEVKKYDPRLALDGGDDGLDFYRKIIQNVGKRLNKKGWLYFEIGQGQKSDVCNLMQEGGFEDIQVVKDYNKIERIVYGRISR